MPADEASAGEAAAALGDLLDQLKTLERAYVRFDLDAIAERGAGARAALERLRQSGTGGLGADRELLRQVMALTRRCQALAEGGASLTGALVRRDALTYRPAPADAREKEIPPRVAGEDAGEGK